MSVFAQPVIQQSNNALVSKINQYIVNECWGSDMKLYFIVDGDKKLEFDTEFEVEDAKLSLVKNSKEVISSLKLESELRDKTYWVMWHSYTKEDHRRLKYNLFLRAVVALLTCNMNSILSSQKMSFVLATEAANFISGEIAIKYFGMKSLGPISFRVLKDKFKELRKQQPDKFKLFILEVLPGMFVSDGWDQVKSRTIRARLQEQMEIGDMPYYTNKIVPAWKKQFGTSTNLASYIQRKWFLDHNKEATHLVTLALKCALTY